jgi:catalase
LGASSTLLDQAKIPATLPTGKSDPGLIVIDRGSSDIFSEFQSALAAHRHYARETDPPRV